jgi:hypothetical protein
VAVLKPMLRVVDIELAAGSGRDGQQVAFVRADHEVTAAQGAFDDADDRLVTTRLRTASRR